MESERVLGVALLDGFLALDLLLIAQIATVVLHIAVVAEVLRVQRLLWMAGSLLLATHLVITVLAHALGVERPLRVGTFRDFVLHALILQLDVLGSGPRAALDTRLDGINVLLDLLSERQPVDFGLRHVDQLLLDADVRVSLLVEAIHGDRVHLVLLQQLDHLRRGLGFLLRAQSCKQRLGVVVAILILVLLGFNLLALQDLLLKELDQRVDISESTTVGNSAGSVHELSEGRALLRRVLARNVIAPANQQTVHIKGFRIWSVALGILRKTLVA